MNPTLNVQRKAWKAKSPTFFHFRPLPCKVMGRCDTEVHNSSSSGIGRKPLNWEQLSIFVIVVALYIYIYKNQEKRYFIYIKHQKYKLGSTVTNRTKETKRTDMFKSEGNSINFCHCGISQTNISR